MAEPVKAAGPGSRAAPAGLPRSRPDVASLVGILLAVTGVIGGLLLERGSIQDVAQTTAAIIVMGGTFGAVLVTTPMPIFLRALRALKLVFLAPESATVPLIDRLIELATMARRGGIISLETEADELPDPFLRRALGLAVDGMDLQELRKIMEIDIIQGEIASEAEAKVWDAAGGYAPTVGILGAVMGLIQVMKHLEDITAVGHGIAVAFVATVYGVGSANLVFLPAASKLRARYREVSLLKEIGLEGVAGIVEGLNPTLLRTKLACFDPRAGRVARPLARPRAVAAAMPQATDSAVARET